MIVIANPLWDWFGGSMFQRLFFLDRKVANNHGFTLIELIVSVLIIGILSSFGFMMYEGYREKIDHSEAKLMTNQIMKGIQSFYLEEGYYPTNWADIATKVTPFMTCDGVLAGKRGCTRNHPAWFSVSTNRYGINNASSPGIMNCIIITPASYELCGRRNSTRIQLTAKEYSALDPKLKSNRKSISSCFNKQTGAVVVMSQSTRDEVWIGC
tara:strand:+ start:369 stop:1001 length:633 start_codon:yes stop_codon:yes gene_type:complete